MKERKPDMNEIYAISDLSELEAFLNSQTSIEKLREKLFAEFLKYADYKSVSEWNKAVRLCECLAVIGWGNHEPVEAFRGIFFNGNPRTFFCNRFGELRFVEAVWSKRKAGFTMEQSRTSYYPGPDCEDKKQPVYWDYPVTEKIEDIKIESQRNWIPKNPIWIVRTISNCYENSKPVIESIEEKLQDELNKKMRPEKYGKAVNCIFLNCSFSYYDNAHCKTNYIIDETGRKLSNQEAAKELQKLYTKKEISENGYYLRPRFQYGPFKTDTGKINADIHFEKEFGQLTHQQQKEKLAEYFLVALKTIAEKQKKKIPGYDFNLMIADFTEIINKWKV
nr:hypothetical protein [Treponema sp. OMZ 799]